VNVAAALLILAVLLALFTPIADPARIGVNSQLARLEAGKTPAERFDYRYLRFEGGRYGRAALEHMAQHAEGANAAVLRREAAAVLALNDKERWQGRLRATSPVAVANNLTAWPAGAQLPASFLAQKWEAIPDGQKPDCLTRLEGKCDAFIVDMNGDGRPEVLLVALPGGGAGTLFGEDDHGNWAVLGHLSYRFAGCRQLDEKLRSGAYTVAAPRLKELDIGGQRIGITPVVPDEAPCAALK
jgi:hypothetical protein